MTHHDETEADTRATRIDPALKAAGWGVVQASQVKREVIAPGRIVQGGKRANPMSSDYVLLYRDQKLAVIEAKRAGIDTSEGVAQAKEYASRLKARFAYATNGLTWYEIDMDGGERTVAGPPSPDDLWGRALSPPRTTGATALVPCRSRMAAASGRRAITSTTRFQPPLRPWRRASNASC